MSFSILVTRTWESTHSRDRQLRHFNFVPHNIRSRSNARIGFESLPRRFRVGSLVGRGRFPYKIPMGSMPSGFSLFLHFPYKSALCLNHPHLTSYRVPLCTRYFSSRSVASHQARHTPRRHRLTSRKKYGKIISPKIQNLKG